MGGVNLDRVQGLGRELKRAKGEAEDVVDWHTEDAPAALTDMWDRRPRRGHAAAERPASVRGSGY